MTACFNKDVLNQLLAAQPEDSENLIGDIKPLCDERPIFHSEADFQFALAQKIKEYFDFKNEEVGIRLEYPFSEVDENETEGDRSDTESTERNRYIDIVLKLDGGKKMIPIELKYKTVPLSQEPYRIDGGDAESFNLKDHNAYDQAMYDSLHDIERLERLKRANEGYTIWLTNDSRITKGPEKRRVAQFDAFRIHSGEGAKSGDLKGHVTNRAGEIHLCGNYEIDWKPYGNPLKGCSDDRQFKYALLRITKDKCSTCSNPTSHQYD